MRRKQKIKPREGLNEVLNRERRKYLPIWHFYDIGLDYDIMFRMPVINPYIMPIMTAKTNTTSKQARKKSMMLIIIKHLPIQS